MIKTSIDRSFFIKQRAIFPYFQKVGKSFERLSKKGHLSNLIALSIWFALDSVVIFFQNEKKKLKVVV